MLQEAKNLAETLVERPPLSMRLAKQILTESMEMSPRAALIYVDRALAARRPTEDAREAMAAFREKRKPVFTGR